MKAWYQFALGVVDGGQELSNELGGKGANLAEMCRLGVRVPPGFTLPTRFSAGMSIRNEYQNKELKFALADGVAFIEQQTGREFGGREKPLLLSVRSGARISMPGMMDTVLNIGLNMTTLEALGKESGSRRFALDSYRRLIEMFGNVVMGVERQHFARCLEEEKRRACVQEDVALGEKELERVIEAMLGVYQKETKEKFTEDPREQLKRAAEAVFDSWMCERAKTYRRLHAIPDEWGTAANVQAMVFGNIGETSGTGVVFTRNPVTGENKLMGEWLKQAQGEDVVAGIRTPSPIAEAPNSLEKQMPKVYLELCETLQSLEHHYRDAQDVEFTIEEGKLFILQTRKAKRTAQAEVRIAVESAEDGLISQREALLRVNANRFSELMHPILDLTHSPEPLAKGLGASPGAAVGAIIFSTEKAVELSLKGEPVVLVRKETSPEDIEGMHVAQGILTAQGGATSHAAVVARAMGKPCIVGCQALHVDEAAKVLRIETSSGEVSLQEGMILSLDGASGAIYEGELQTLSTQTGKAYHILMRWADEARRMKVKANADTPEQARVAVQFGAEGIGLCRTEHMFFGEERLPLVRKMILAENSRERQSALEALEPMQREDFKSIFEIMAGRSVTVRLLDPPLHEFLPHEGEEIKRVATFLGTTPALLEKRIETLREQNPMLGHRGCRLGITFPEIYDMQARALCTAVYELVSKGFPCVPKLMVPLVMLPRELQVIRARMEKIADEILGESRAHIEFSVGTMIELPRAALIAGEIAAHADFFSFGTNDLTQTTLGLSRDDSNRFLPHYLEQKLLGVDPFVSLDQSGVGRLVALATEEGKAQHTKLRVGICGEHGGDPESIQFFEQCALDSISCSPYRLPVARLAAAQATIRLEKANVE